MQVLFTESVSIGTVTNRFIILANFEVSSLESCASDKITLR